MNVLVEYDAEAHLIEREVLLL